ncbi:hypothetical protein DUI87_14412 [Hirundo rustica rustica]|uniref:Reverse transcriptase domain-containing protein n=1 Tax=Hirundo rustica rustica TaxID=333673 RepID=A0A3M0KDQ4_HIRRU|nr:hypothetical protein DUI87_14412 [Hirundo rustica rustica]
MAKEEVFNALFASVFNMDDKPRGSQCPGLEDHDWEIDQLPLDPEIVRDLLLRLDPYNSMGPDEIHLRILKELLMSSQKLSIIFELCWESGEDPADWKMENIVLIFKKGKKEGPWNLQTSKSHFSA